jgi:hypothetical protein
MADYIFPRHNDGLKITDPVITKVHVSFDDNMADNNLLNLTVYIGAPAVFSESMEDVPVISMDYDRAGLFLLAQAELDSRYKVS